MNILFKKYSTYILSITIIVITTISLIVSLYYSSISYVTKDINKVNIKEIDNLIIVSHPGDEILFSGAHLLQDNYLVVCISCGLEKETTLDFIEVINKTQDQYIILGYPEYSNKERTNWYLYEESIEKDISNIIKLKEWNTVTTHNSEGEYGNTQHKLISKIVSRNTNQKNLYYFGKYYNKQTIVNYKDEFSQINNNLINKKIKLLGTYKKDDYLQTEFSHIYNYEEWIKYKEWSK